MVLDLMIRRIRVRKGRGQRIFMLDGGFYVEEMEYVVL